MDKKKLLPSMAVIFIMAAIIINPSRYILSAQNGMILFAMSVLPALFPFFFFSKLLSMFQADQALGNMLSKPLKRLYNIPPSGGYIMVMSLMCGYPVGAKLISEYHDQNILTKDEASGIAAMASTSGPLFILGTIGSIILHNKSAALVILVSHYLSAFINGIIYRNNREPSHANIPAMQSLTLKDSIYNAVISILMVGGYIIVFNIIIDVLIDIKVFEILTKLLSPALGGISKGMLCSIVEVTRGTAVIGKSNSSLIQMTAAIAAGVTFGGMSIIIQSITFLESTGLKTYKFLLMKFSQSLIAYIIALIISMLFL